MSRSSMSTIRKLEHCFRQPLTFHWDLRRRLADLVEINGTKGHVNRREVLFETSHLGRTGDRHDPRLLREQPRERNLRWRRALLRRHALQQIDERHVCRTCLSGEPRRNVAKIVVGELRGRIDLSGKKACAERAK